MKRRVIILGIFLLTLSVRAQNNKLPQLGEGELEEIITAMTPEEKVSLLIGAGKQVDPVTGDTPKFLKGAAGCTKEIQRLGIPMTVLTDGPAGLRINPQQDKSNVRFYCTAFPTATALSASWNIDLLESVGEAMGNEVHEYGSDVLLAPGINIQRNPLCGRNFEYYSEDPLISGKMGAAMIRGIQSVGVGASLKHFAANNIETNRNSINAVISQRALREIYLRGFEIAVKEGDPWTVMSSYNRLNGFYTSENYDLITNILRKEWNFKGIVMSDWGGGADAVAQMNAGNDLIMPGRTQNMELLNALKNKTIDEKVINENVTRILSFILKTPSFNKYKYSNHPDLNVHAQIARQAATEGMVLLKNRNNVLPFKNIKRVALFGKSSYRFIAGGTGSGEVNYEKAISIKDGFLNGGYKIVKPLNDIYNQFIDSILANSKPNKKHNLKQIVDFHPELEINNEQIKAQVKSSDIALITIGRNAGEGYDRDTMDFSLTVTEKKLIKDVSAIYHAVGKKVIVVLNIGSVITTSDWTNEPDAILLAWQTGQEGGNALVDILSGNVNPSGKLPMTFPVKYSDVPSANTFPGEPKKNPVNAFYSEGIYVGYRYYDTFKIPVEYEFGYGLSYTQFQYSDIKISSNTFLNKLDVTITIKNTGKLPGKEVVELYLRAPDDSIEKPFQELKGFAKTKILKPNESQTLFFSLDARSLASFWPGLCTWVVDKGTYEVCVGASSKDIRQKISFIVPQTMMLDKVNNVLYPNYVIKELSKNNK